MIASRATAPHKAPRLFSGARSSQIMFLFAISFSQVEAALPSSHARRRASAAFLYGSVFASAFERRATWPVSVSCPCLSMGFDASLSEPLQCPAHLQSASSFHQESHFGASSRNQFARATNPSIVARRAFSLSNSGSFSWLSSASGSGRSRVGADSNASSTAAATFIKHRA